MPVANGRPQETTQCTQSPSWTFRAGTFDTWLQATRTTLLQQTTPASRGMWQASSQALPQYKGQSLFVCTDVRQQRRVCTCAACAMAGGCVLFVCNSELQMLTIKCATSNQIYYTPKH